MSIGNLVYKNAAVGILIIILVIAIDIGLFFLFRAITCWYLKINKMLKELQKSNEYLERIAIAAERGANVPPMGRPYGNGPVAPGPMMPGGGPAPVVPNQAVPAAGNTVISPMQGNAAAFQPGAAIVAPEAVNAAQKADTVVEPSKEAQAPEKRICKQCGAVLQDGAAFCIQCGTRN